MRVDFHAQASAELEAATDWYLERSVRAADGFLREVERGLRLIAETPEFWPEFEAGTRRCVLRDYPYSLIYRLQRDGLLVVAVMHSKREPGYWHNRE